MTEARAKVINLIREGLQSSEQVLVNKALAKISAKGDASLLPDLINLWDDSDDQTTKKDVESILFGLKDNKALDALILYIGTDVSEEKKWLALNAIWQSGFDASAHLTSLLDFAIHHSYTNAMDVMTIIENSTFDETNEDLVDTNLMKLSDYLLKNKSDNLRLLLEIKSILIEKKIEG